MQDLNVEWLSRTMLRDFFPPGHDNNIDLVGARKARLNTYANGLSESLSDIDDNAMNEATLALLAGDFSTRMYVLSQALRHFVHEQQRVGMLVLSVLRANSTAYPRPYAVYAALVAFSLGFAQRVTDRHGLTGCFRIDTPTVEALIDYLENIRHSKREAESLEMLSDVEHHVYLRLFSNKHTHGTGKQAYTTNGDAQDMNEQEASTTDPSNVPTTTEAPDDQLAPRDVVAGVMSQVAAITSPRDTSGPQTDDTADLIRVIFRRICTLHYVSLDDDSWYRVSRVLGAFRKAMMSAQNTLEKYDDAPVAMRDRVLALALEQAALHMDYCRDDYRDEK